MESTLSVTEAQAQFPKVLRELEQRGTITVQRRGKIAAFLVSPDRMEAIVESMEILANAEAMKAIRDFEAGAADMKDVSCLDEE